MNENAYAPCEQCGEANGTARFCGSKCRARHWRENGGKSGSGEPHKRGGVWICQPEAFSVAVFRTELEALRFANEHDAKALFVRFSPVASGGGVA